MHDTKLAEKRVARARTVLGGILFRAQGCCRVTQPAPLHHEPTGEATRHSHTAAAGTLAQLKLMRKRLAKQKLHTLRSPTRLFRHPAIGTVKVASTSHPFRQNFDVHTPLSGSSHNDSVCDPLAGRPFPIGRFATLGPGRHLYNELTRSCRTASPSQLHIPARNQKVPRTTTGRTLHTHQLLIFALPFLNICSACALPMKTKATVKYGL